MTLSTILEVALGLVIFFYVLSHIVQAITGKIDEILAYQAKDLEQVLRDMLTSTTSKDATVANEFAENFNKLKNNPLIQNLAPEPTFLREKFAYRNHVGKLLPDRIPAKTFSLALFNTLFPEEDAETDIDKIREALNKLPEGDTKTSLLALLNASDNKIEDFRDKVEGWFNDGMNRVSAIYRVHTRRISFIIALVLVIFVDANAIAVTERLWNEPTWRAAVSAEAQDIAEEHSGDDSVSAVFDQLGTLDFPVFKYLELDNFLDLGYWFDLKHLFGLAITWFSLSLGASFWYDMMKRLKGEESAPAATT